MQEEPIGRLAVPGGGRRSGGRGVEEFEVEGVDLLEGFAGDALEVAVEAGGGFEDAGDFGFAFGPLFEDDFAFLVEVVLHRGEGFDDGFDAVLELRAREILVDVLGLGLQTLSRLAGGGDAQQRLAEDEGQGQNAAADGRSRCRRCDRRFRRILEVRWRG